MTRTSVSLLFLESFNDCSSGGTAVHSTVIYVSRVFSLSSTLELILMLPLKLRRQDDVTIPIL